MALSTELISQFVKATKDEPDVKREKTVYGTIVMSNGVKYVQIDGSELLTPISTTTNVHSGERVTVMIKNHTATVTGNISSPAARIDDINGIADVADRIIDIEDTLKDKVDIDTLETESLRIDELVSENTTMKTQIAANAAEIAELKTIIAELTAST